MIPLTLPFPELQEGFTDTTTPWHSDEAYWLDLADKRALSFWFPMQDVNVSKGVLAINTDTDMIDINQFNSCPIFLFPYSSSSPILATWE